MLWKTKAEASLADLPLFAMCTPREIERIDRLMSEVPVRAGEVLVREGGSGRECFVIADGTAAVTIDGRRVATLGRGAVVGEMALLDGGRRTATVMAETPMRIYVMDPASFESLLRDVPLVARKVMAVLSRRLRTAETAAR